MNHHAISLSTKILSILHLISASINISSVVIKELINESFWPCICTHKTTWHYLSRSPDAEACSITHSMPLYGNKHCHVYRKYYALFEYNTKACLKQCTRSSGFPVRVNILQKIINTNVWNFIHLLPIFRYF